MKKDKIELWFDGTKVSFSTDGGNLEKFSVGGRDILYSDNFIEINGEKKKRGGIPILFPWAGALENLPQHGFARDMEWEIIEKKPDKISLKLEDNEQTLKIFPYHFLNELKVELSDKELSYSLNVFNKDCKDMPIAFGLHPYFKIPADFKNLKTNIVGFEPRNYELTKTLFFPIQSVEINIPNWALIKLNFSGGFERREARLAIWSDKTDYLCVEPWSTPLGGFLKENERMIILPGEKAEFNLKIQVFLR